MSQVTGVLWGVSSVEGVSQGVSSIGVSTGCPKYKGSNGSLKYEGF